MRRRITDLVLDIFFGCGIFFGFASAVLILIALAFGIPLAFLYAVVRVARFAWQ